jgi:hypothetical protein
MDARASNRRTHIAAHFSGAETETRYSVIYANVPFASTFILKEAIAVYEPFTLELQRPFIAK